MKIVCKDCGKTFELTDGERDFFLSKGLSLPKRCKACRNKNKPNSNNNRNFKPTYNKLRFKKLHIYLLAIVLIGVFSKLVIDHNLSKQITNDVFSTSYIEEISTNYTEKIYTQGITTTYTEEITTTSAEEITTTSAEEITTTSAKEITTTSVEEITATYTEEITTTSTIQYNFRKTEYLEEHFQKHGGEMGCKNSEEYLEKANLVILSEFSLTRIQDDEDTAYFLESTGEFVVVSSDGYIRTYFIPNDGIEYFNRQ